MDIHGRRLGREPEEPGSSAAPVSKEIDYVLVRANQVWGPDAARIWITSANAFLGGARPLEVLEREGAARLIEVLRAEMWGGAA